jgi:hypothetical protein
MAARYHRENRKYFGVGANVQTPGASVQGHGPSACYAWCMKSSHLPIALFTVAFASRAYADTPVVQSVPNTTEGAEAAARSEPEAPTVEHHYGAETFAADGISAGVMLASLFLPSTRGVVGSIGLGGYVLAAPALHLSHGNPGRALGSLGLRLGLPVALGAGGAYVGFALASKGCVGIQCFGSVVVAALLGGVGLVGGMVSASVLDGSLLARERVPVHAPVVTPPVSLSPYVIPNPQGSEVGINAGGRF